MIWLIVTTVFVCAAFSGTYLATGDIWSAFLAGGIPALLYMLGLTVQAICRPAGRCCRVATLVVALVVLTGVSAQFVVMSSCTRWRSDRMVSLGITNDRSEIMAALFEKASPTFYAFENQGQRRKQSMADVFKAMWHERDWRSPAVLLDSPSERTRIYASIARDGSVMLTGVALVTAGTDPQFTNVNGTSGHVQSRLHLSAKGMDYEIEN